MGIIRDFKKLKTGDSVKIFGWAHRIRRHGKMIFVDLRNRSGIVQCVIKGEEMKKLDSVLEESVLEIDGTVVERMKKNPNIEFGNLEIQVENVNVLSKAKPLPLEIKNPDIIRTTKEETRLKWRYLDLRRPEIMKNLLFRAKVAKSFRKFLDDNGFVEIETPYFAKSTPEGSRDFLVPSRIHKGKFYALAQSPQLYKQILMVSGFEKYYQFARCFRDEDPRADRQPEFTQIDIEMSFVNRDDVMKIVEEMIKFVVKETTGKELSDFPVITYKDSMNLYGTDKPDLRIPEKITTDGNLKYIVSDIENDGIIEDLKKIDGIKFSYKGRGNFDDDIKKIPSHNLIIYSRYDNSNWENVSKQLGIARSVIGKHRNLPRDYKFAWIVDFPLFEINESGEITSTHHPFTMVKDEKMLEHPLEATSLAYDIVLNGSEVGGGSIRIHDENVQRKVFEILQLDESEIEKRYGFLLRAFEYGVPPHGGIAFGFDRFVAKLLFKENIREMIAFPKTSDWRDLMSETPSDIPKEYIDETIRPMVEDLKRRKLL